MARRRRATKSGDLLVMSVVGLVTYSIYRQSLPPMSWGLLAVAVLMTWICLLMPTYCDYQTARRKPCSRRVRGKLRGCRDHRREKRDALFAAIRLRNPGLLFRVMWSPSSPSSAPGAFGSVGTATSNAVPQSAPSKQAAGEVAMLIFTVISAVAAVIALFK